jgi:hypothetical protein
MSGVDDSVDAWLSDEWKRAFGPSAAELQAIEKRDVFIEQHSTPVGESKYHRKAKDGWVFMCGACGKQSRDNFGDSPISYGWDESCMLNAQLVPLPEPTTQTEGV